MAGVFVTALSAALIAVGQVVFICGSGFFIRHCNILEHDTEKDAKVFWSSLAKLIVRILNSAFVIATFVQQVGQDDIGDLWRGLVFVAVLSAYWYAIGYFSALFLWFQFNSYDIDIIGVLLCFLTTHESGD